MFQTTTPRYDAAPLHIHRLPIRFVSNVRRVITRYFNIGGQNRACHIVERVQDLCDADVEHILAEVIESFGPRHANIEAVFEENFRIGVASLGSIPPLPRPRRLLIGSYFTMEYSIESAALFNPSIVRHWDQAGMSEGAVRFIMSLRATGEGHLSSIVFRTGVIEPDDSIRMDQPSRFANRMQIYPDPQYEKRLFERKLRDIGVYELAIQLVLGRLGETFTLAELQVALAEAQAAEPARLQLEEATDSILWLAQSNYQLELPPGADPSEVVIFPQTSNESHGLEDLRMVRFVDDDGSVTYYGTCVAYDGYRTLPQMVETEDFHSVRIHTINGARAQNKGMALFPRRIGGHYVMCSRIDGENLYIMYSDIVHFWETAEPLQGPQHPWEFVQIGNCGSPIETPEGWLLLTHGVGPVRTYSIGAMLLDLNDPLKVIGSLQRPLIVPREDERDGYVPNVVYTCGAMAHRGRLYIPFATSDYMTRFAYAETDKLLERLVP